MSGGLGRKAPPQAQGSVAGRDIAPRVVSALLLAAAAIALCFAGVWWFAVLVALSGAVIAWEWGRVVRSDGLGAATAVHAAVMGAAAVLASLDRFWLGLGAIVLGAGLTAAIERKSEALSWSVAGLVLTGIVAMALIWLRADPAWGALAILYLFLIVWVTDSAAFATGRLLGGPKLMPRVSPKKRWSGFVGGLFFPTVAGVAFATAVGLENRVAMLAAQSLLLAFSTQAGDLAESAVKRKFGVKDASALIPGHGGLLDRVDGLMLAAFVAAVIAALRDPANPGRGLLVWS